VLAVTVVLQALHGLPDSEAVQALRCDLRWKAACGLGLLDAGFHPSLLTYFRRRLARSAEPGRLFAKVKEVVAATGVLAGKHRRALDSTVLDDAVATQDTVTQLVAAVRRVIREVPGAAGAAAVCTAHDYRDPGKPKIAWNDGEARAALVSALVNDALALLADLPAQPGGPAADAVGLLALVAGQDVEPAEGSDGTDGRWRIARRTAPDRMVSVVDPDARHVHKNRTRRQDGFKAHVSFEPETGLFTAVELTGGSGAGNHEATVAARLLAGEADEGEEKLTVLGDSAYGTGELRRHLRDAGHAAVIKPPPLPQAVPGGFTADDFTADDQAGTVISVDPLLSQTMQPYAYADGNPVSYVDPSGQARLNWWPDWKTVLELRLKKRETALVWLVIVKLHLPSVLTFLHLLPSWMRDLLINVLVRGLINVIPAAAHAIVTNGCLKFDFRWWGALDLGVYYSSWTGCTGSYWPEIPSLAPQRGKSYA
jgi:hypothetical protein